MSERSKIVTDQYAPRSPIHIATHQHTDPAVPHTTLIFSEPHPGGSRCHSDTAPEVSLTLKIRYIHRILVAQIHGKVHKTGAVRSGTWRGRGAAHAPASILVRPPRGYHCNMAATHFLAEVLR
ncbi:hypothetical protein ACJJTC_011140 [Scirpophaga incertulas]